MESMERGGRGGEASSATAGGAWVLAATHTLIAHPVGVFLQGT